ncbi:alpha/beta hydrolase family esterase [Rhizobium alvei]|uniref:PHB depolymerase family esterase n=1 Tax=Rhizobium alvei TaxID=1132659 RepID=A0ABT8YKI2_9HYPH|nr:PHB depolymerase family esterase [Rhizobium alvei]MDO6963804.1 PHB depolymerase family esterase [Rhizobium alvei]
MRRFPFFLSLVLSCLFSLTGPLSAKSPKDPTRLTIETRDGPRYAYLRLNGRAGPQPTVIVLHGRIAAAKRVIAKYDFDEVGRARGFTTVFPDGYKARWQDGRVKKGKLSHIDDVAFLKDLVDRLVKDGVADRRRIYLAGISNGGMMAYRITCEAPGLFAGYATTLASMPEAFADCPIKPVPLLAINASKDQVVPFQGGVVAHLPNQGQVLGARATLERFAKANGCRSVETTSLPDHSKTDGVSVLRHVWTGCRAGKPLIAYDVLGGGHAVSSGDTLPVHVFGKASPDINTATIFMDFFRGL